MAAIQSLNAEVFTFPLAIVLIPIAVSAVFFFLGVILGVILVLRWQEVPEEFRLKRAVGLLIPFGVAAVAAGVFAPDMWRDRIVVTPEAISFTKGFWFYPEDLNIAYRDVNFVRRWSPRRHIVGDPLHWEVHFLDGTVEDVPLGDLGKYNIERIEHLTKAYGVRFR